MPLPALIVVPVAAAAPWMVRKFVQYAWGPMLVGLGYMMKTRLGLFIATAFLWLGINFASINLIIEPTIDVLTGAVNNVRTGGTGAAAGALSQYVGLMQFDKAITMVVSAVITKHALLKGRLFLFRRGTL